MLKLNGETVFSIATKSFENYFNTDLFVFAIRDIYNTKEFINNEIQKLGIKNFKIICLDNETKGQAETAYIALKAIDTDEKVTIFNIDTFRYGYKKPDFYNTCDGYLEVFQAPGEHWSFVEPGNNNKVIRTTEKDRISDLCSDGLYHFKNKQLFIDLFEDALHNNETVKGEYYIAPLYNKLIKEGLEICYDLIEVNQIDFCGTPDEYQHLLIKQGE